MEAVEGKEIAIERISEAITVLEELQSDCDDGMLWHSYMKMIDELGNQLDLLTRG